MKKKSKAVKVVVAPSAFPDFSSFSSSSNSTTFGTSSVSRKTSRNHSSVNDNTKTKRKGIDIDFDETAREIYALGSSQFTGKQKRRYQEEQYNELTGREKKKQKVPLKIVRGIKNAAAKRGKRISQEEKDAGIITATNGKGKKKKAYSEQNRRDTRIHGPSPNIGFTKKGVLSVTKDRR
mmetsp:Transcript_3925/g.5123  ORF Transcript_3925/g.5123 Transcript_3925/m.5123 type:complete len:179 (+) Transcript_3925:114-650(+)